MENKIREQIKNIAKDKGITFEEEIEIIRKGFNENKELNDMSDWQGQSAICDAILIPVKRKRGIK